MMQTMEAKRGTITIIQTMMQTVSLAITVWNIEQSALHWYTTVSDVAQADDNGLDDEDGGDGFIDFTGANDDDEDGFGMLDGDDGMGLPVVPTAGASSGFELIDEPERLEALSIGYAKVAKLVDVKKLKHSLWNQLCEDPEEAGKPASRTSIAPKTQMPSSKSFQEVLQTLPPQLPAKQRSDISVPYCFICLLHLANEKGLSIESEGGDLRITQA
jgi:condensin complex subunit 2